MCPYVIKSPGTAMLKKKKGLARENIFEVLPQSMMPLSFITFYRVMMELEMLFQMNLTRLCLE